MARLHRLRLNCLALQLPRRTIAPANTVNVILSITTKTAQSHRDFYDAVGSSLFIAPKNADACMMVSWRKVLKRMFGRSGGRDNLLRAQATPETPRALSLLSPEEVCSLGHLPNAAICGFFVGTDQVEANFQPNKDFINFMHKVIGVTGENDVSLQSAAKIQRDGYVYVIDLRTPEGPQGRVPPEDILGGFKVNNGKIVHNSYIPNNLHKIFTKNGIVRLPTNIHKALTDALKA